MNYWDKNSVCNACLPSFCPSVTLWVKLSFKETIQHIVFRRHSKINIGWNKNSTFFSDVGFLFNLELSIPRLELNSFSNKLFDIFHQTSFNLFVDELYAQFADKTTCKASDIFLFLSFDNSFGPFWHKPVSSRNLYIFGQHMYKMAGHPP